MSIDGSLRKDPDGVDAAVLTSTQEPAPEQQGVRRQAPQQQQAGEQETQARTYAPGWYRAGDEMRWWDGMSWTNKTRPMAQATQQARSVPATPEKWPAGWYDVKDRPNTRGYWDGEKWTGDYVPADQKQDGDGPTALVPLGYVTAVLIPIVGFIIGIVAATRPQKRISKQGPFIILLSIVVFVIWLAVIVNAAQHAASSCVIDPNTGLCQ